MVQTLGELISVKVNAAEGKQPEESEASNILESIKRIGFANVKSLSNDEAILRLNSFQLTVCLPLARKSLDLEPELPIITPDQLDWTSLHSLYTSLNTLLGSLQDYFEALKAIDNQLIVVEGKGSFSPHRKVLKSLNDFLDITIDSHDLYVSKY